ncbi:alpha/beta hydrolase [Lichenihabitans sp. PAMC28606]|uniref:alpha/beta hydrolase n=1 Tax=Lichenihabitans sp. PAMC28606 TaxID=2880932 RepID=UPI001D0BD5BE|nr:alpha/beta hydrolase [Lichenihabitans sp. PAMC28606]UDL96391.1 alpha/beta hydrolase [Lichenihabitans sp. PAMC28606]
MSWLRWAVIAGVLVTAAALPARLDARERATPELAPEEMRIAGGLLPLSISADWSRPLPAITRAVIIVHGKNRDAVPYFQSLQAAAQDAAATADTLLIAPQFLRGQDECQIDLPPGTLTWRGNDWMDDAPDETAGVASFVALDAILARLADRVLFPHLTSIVVAGHSGGAQMVQRFAIVTTSPETLAKVGVAVRFVVADPSSYAYFDDARPVTTGGFAAADTAMCPALSRWKYGMADRPPAIASLDVPTLERRYIQHDVTMLLGGADDDPDQAALDTSCAAEAQGPDRLARGRHFAAYLEARHPGLTIPVLIAPGVGHDGGALLRSSCGLKALFSVGRCPD